MKLENTHVGRLTSSDGPESDIVVSFRITGDPKPSSKYYVSLVLYSQKKNLCDSNEFIGSIFS
jgi:hypothetical protein